jgi:hypothetical protein
VPSGDVQRALQSLEAAALRTINVFGAQLTNTMHAMAKALYTPTNPLVLEALELQAGTFMTQERAERGKHAVGVCDDGAGARGGMMRVLEVRAETVAGLFTAQEVANTLGVQDSA